MPRIDSEMHAVPKKAATILVNVAQGFRIETKELKHKMANCFERSLRREDIAKASALVTY